MIPSNGKSVQYSRLVGGVQDVSTPVVILVRRMTQQTDYSHRTAVQKLGIKAAQRLEVSGDVGSELRRDVREALGRGFVRGGQLDGAIVAVDSVEHAEELLDRYRPRVRDTGYLWLVTRKRNHERYVNQMDLVPAAKERGLIDNKTCSLDESRSAIRFVVPRASRRR